MNRTIHNMENDHVEVLQTKIREATRRAESEAEEIWREKVGKSCWYKGVE